MKTYTFHVTGTHCASCKILIEDMLGDVRTISHAHVDLKHETVTLSTEETDHLQLMQNLNTQLSPHGYTLSADTSMKESHGSNDIWKAIPLGITVLILFFVLQKSGVLNVGIGGATTPVTSFIIGLVASVSSCLAVVGGLILSLSAKLSESGSSTKRPFLLFHTGRLVGFIVLGGVLGLIGRSIGSNYIVQAVLMMLAACIMIGLGFNLLGITKHSKVTLPSGVFTFFRNITQRSSAPLLLGVITFFLPCGFTQSMQVAALSSGSLVSGALIMGAFALGTLPVLLLLSFGTSTFARSRYASLFFKSAGVVVIGLGVFALLSQLTALGIINPLFSL